MTTVDMPSVVTAGRSVAESSASSAGMSNLNVNADTFLQLLVAQYEYQDPLSPQSDTDFIAQLAQMSSLEEIGELKDEVHRAQSYGLVGQYAYAESVNSKSGEISSHYGVIDSVVNKSGTFYAFIADELVNVSDIVQIVDPDMMNADTSIVEASNLIGKTVTGTYEDGAGNAPSITGVVSGVSCNDGAFYVKIDGVLVGMNTITAVNETAAANEETQTTETENGGNVL